MIKLIWRALQKRWWRLSVPVRLRQLGVEQGDSIMCYGMPIVSMAPNSSIRIADRVVLTSHSAFTALGVSRPCVLRTMRPEARIEIAADTGCSGLTVCAAVSVIIGRECLIGADVLIADNDFHAINPVNRRYNRTESEIVAKPVVIGDNVFIGARSMILKGVRIGDNSVIGAGSVVSSDIPSGVIAAGVPARVLRKIS
jgi:acetyltransferase-like isoleucine patch superfamily enzyme